MRRRTRPQDSGYVYIIGNREYGWYKIGKALSTYQRLKEHQVSCPVELEVILEVHADNRHTYEIELHKRYTKNRIRGEWFKFTPDEIEEIKNYIWNRGSNGIISESAQSSDELVFSVCPEVSPDGLQETRKISFGELRERQRKSLAHPRKRFPAVPAPKERTRDSRVPSRIPVDSIQYQIETSDK